MQNIEANQYAQIQLQANSLAPVTEQSFLDKVHFNYQKLLRIKDFHSALPKIFSTEIRSYIDGCLAKGEQVAVLAFTRDDIKCVNQILETQYPNKTCVSLVPEKMNNSTVISSFIKKYWSSISFTPLSNIMFIITRSILHNLKYIVFDDQKAMPAIQKLLDEWHIENKGRVDAWVNQYNKGQLTYNEVLDFVKDDLIKFEIGRNAIKQSLLSARNQQAKKDNAAVGADFVLSTIHSAKGLEFQNVIVLYKNDNQMDEDKKRMYYVALTRAMNSEYILAYDIMSSPQIQADYITVLEGLHSTHPAANSPIDMMNAQKARKKIRI